MTATTPAETFTVGQAVRFVGKSLPALQGSLAHIVADNGKGNFRVRFVPGTVGKTFDGDELDLNACALAPADLDALLAA